MKSSKNSNKSDPKDILFVENTPSNVINYAIDKKTGRLTAYIYNLEKEKLQHKLDVQQLIYRFIAFLEKIEYYKEKREEKEGGFQNLS